MRLLKTLFFLLIPFAQWSQTYNDVAVIINDSSDVSSAVGHYFRIERSIPNQNIIHISASLNETIDSLEFEAIRQQIEDHLIVNGLENTINYIVTTKGVPLWIERHTCDFSQSGPNQVNCTTVDSELTLILSSNSSGISNVGAIINPYFEENAHFSKAVYDMYIVTRLDGYTFDDIKNMIDRSGPNTPVNKLSHQIVLDPSLTVPDSTYFNDQMSTLNQSMLNDGWQTTYHPDTTWIYNQPQVLGYSRITNNLSINPVNNEWVAGSISNVLDFNSEISFVPNTITDTQTLADLISEGCTGGHTNAAPTYYSYQLRDSILFNRYLDSLENYNLGESYYMAIRPLSWNDLVIGDPKTTVIIDNTLSIPDPTLDEITIGPNPSTGQVFVQANDLLINAITVVNYLGQVVYRETPKTTGNIHLDLGHLSSGTYFMQVETDTQLYSSKIVIMD
ncbi:MAG: TIGR03790 family protein [Crocinitomicaceae bacterium]|nr:TIGR03790 family protein [Crocinitomicaceae bacterium]